MLRFDYGSGSGSGSKSLSRLISVFVCEIGTWLYLGSFLAFFVGQGVHVGLELGLCWVGE